MRPLRRAAAIVASAAALIGGCRDSPTSPAIGSREHLQRIVDSVRAAVNVPGAIVAVRAANEEEMILTSGVSDVAALTPMPPSARFRIGSVTKTMVAQMVLELVEDGAIALDDPVAEYLGDVITNAATITVRQLLNHTSGVFDYTLDQQFLAAVGANPGRTWTPSELLAVANRNQPVFAPGAANRWSYSNTNYIVLGMLFEHVANVSLAAALDARIFGPHGMTSSSLPSTPTLPTPFARGYVRQGSLVDVTTLLSPSVAWAAGAVVSNASDLVRWAEALATGAGLRADLHAARLTAVAASGAVGYGLGVLSFDGWIGHDGLIPGYDVLMLSKPGVGTLVAMVNMSTGGLAFELVDAIARAKFGTGF